MVAQTDTKPTSLNVIGECRPGNPNAERERRLVHTMAGIWPAVLINQ